MPSYPVPSRPVPSPQARLGVDVEGVFRRYDPEESGAVLRSDFVAAVMELGVGLLDSSNTRWAFPFLFLAENFEGWEELVG